MSSARCQNFIEDRYPLWVNTGPESTFIDSNGQRGLVVLKRELSRLLFVIYLNLVVRIFLPAAYVV